MEVAMHECVSCALSVSGHVLIWKGVCIKVVELCCSTSMLFLSMYHILFMAAI